MTTTINIQQLNIVKDTYNFYSTFCIESQNLNIWCLLVVDTMDYLNKMIDKDIKILIFILSLNTIHLSNISSKSIFIISPIIILLKFFVLAYEMYFLISLFY